MPIAPLPEPAGGGSGGGGGGRWAQYGDWIVGPAYEVRIPAPYNDGWYAWPGTTTTTTGGSGGGGSGTWNLTGSTAEWTTMTWQGQRLMYLQEDDAVTAEDREIERAAHQARTQYLAEEREQRARERVLATSRGEELLTSMLDEAQLANYRLDGEFLIIGSHGTVYKVKRGTSGNIEWLKADGEPGGRLCAHPSMRESWLPTEDVMLAQVLALRTDEREFCRVANVHWGSRPPIMEGIAA